MKEQKCEIHDHVLKPANIPIHYGLPHIDDEFIEARQRLFPNANASVLGGCIIGDEDEMELPVCEKCREAEKKWREENNR